jgi:hypothetical protein
MTDRTTEDELGSIPEPIEHDRSAALRLTVSQNLERALIEHMDDDAKVARSIDRRLIVTDRRIGKLNHLRIYAAGILAALGAIGALIVYFGSDIRAIMGLAFKDSIAPAIEKQMSDKSTADRAYIGANISALKESVDKTLATHEKRLEALEAARPQRRRNER